jgi:heptosyltransferase-1
VTDVLLVKMSSLGDVVHALPAMTDAAKARPALRFDWVVEEAFVPIARLHPAVRDVYPIALRRWRGAPWQSRVEWHAFRDAMRSRHYDVVLDAQGLLKSAIVSANARGERVGLDGRSAREPLASVAYSRALRVPWGQHAIIRLRQLFAQALDYPLPEDATSSAPDFGTRAPSLPTADAGMSGRYLLLLHGTTWDNKQWPLAHWRTLCARAAAAGWPVRVAHAGAGERARAQAIVDGCVGAALLPPSTLEELLPWLAHAAAVVSVDSGLGHLAAAFAVPTLMLYGPTDALRTGGMGARVRNIDAAFACAPCLRRACTYDGPALTDDAGIALVPACLGALAPPRVWDELVALAPGMQSGPMPR